jgi:hypothetical protein
MLDRIDGTGGKNQTRRDQDENMECRAKRLISEGLRNVRWDAERLRTERKGRPVKVRLARKLRREKTMTLQWIAESLCMGSWNYVSNLLRASAGLRKSVKDEDCPEWREDKEDL